MAELVTVAFMILLVAVFWLSFFLYQENQRSNHHIGICRKQNDYIGNIKNYIRELELRCGERDPEEDAIMVRREELARGMDAEVEKIQAYIRGE